MTKQSRNVENELKFLKSQINPQFFIQFFKQQLFAIY
jgi:hypothetical protein